MNFGENYIIYEDGAPSKVAQLVGIHQDWIVTDGKPYLKSVWLFVINGYLKHCAGMDGLRLSIPEEELHQRAIRLLDLPLANKVSPKDQVYSVKGVMYCIPKALPKLGDIWGSNKQYALVIKCGFRIEYQEFGDDQNYENCIRDFIGSYPKLIHRES